MHKSNIYISYIPNLYLIEALFWFLVDGIGRTNLPRPIKATAGKHVESKFKMPSRLKKGDLYHIIVKKNYYLKCTLVNLIIFYISAHLTFTSAIFKRHIYVNLKWPVIELWLILWFFFFFCRWNQRGKWSKAENFKTCERQTETTYECKEWVINQYLGSII